MKYLAIDYGSKRTGLALCDKNEIIASPLVVLDSRKNLLAAIVEIIKSEAIEAVVFGLPLNMDDSLGPQAKTVQLFAEDLKKHIDVPVLFQDERLSSFSANEKLADAQLTFGKKKKLLDAVAAAEILSAFLDAKHSSPSDDFS